MKKEQKTRTENLMKNENYFKPVNKKEKKSKKGKKEDNNTENNYNNQYIIKKIIELVGE